MVRTNAIRRGSQSIEHGRIAGLNGTLDFFVRYLDLRWLETRAIETLRQRYKRCVTPLPNILQDGANVAIDIRGKFPLGREKCREIAFEARFSDVKPQGHEQPRGTTRPSG